MKCRLSVTNISKKLPIWTILVFAVIIGTILWPPGTIASFKGGAATYIICSDGSVATITAPLLENDSPENDNSQDFCDFFISKLVVLPFAFPAIILATQHDVTNVIAKRAYGLISYIRLTTHSSRAPPLLV